MQALGVQKTRKPKFDLSFRILDLNNIPYIAGRIYVKWHVAHASDHDDRTSKAHIKDHKAIFDYNKTTSVKLAIDKNNWLQESIFTLEVIHEVKIGGKEERSLLGVVRINLAEYVEVSKISEEPVTRRYLLHESKINSTIKVSIRLVQTDGEQNFMAPQLRSAPQFVGIAGVMAGEQVPEDDIGPTLTVDPLNKEANSELRELYKKTLAAELSCQPGDPNADQVIEDIFAGGDGWGLLLRDGSDTASSRRGGTGDDVGNWSDGEQQQHHQQNQQQQQQQLRAALGGNKRSWPDFQAAVRKIQAKQTGQNLKRDDQSFLDGRNRSSFSQSSHRTDLTMEKSFAGQQPDLDELEVREDLRCWISRPAA